MNISASIMTAVPYPTGLVVSLIAFIVIGSLVVAGFFIRDIMKNRQQSHLEITDSDPELNTVKKETTDTDKEHNGREKLNLQGLAV